jgi:hypothetical protein
VAFGRKVLTTPKIQLLLGVYSQMYFLAIGVKVSKELQKSKKV